MATETATEALTGTPARTRRASDLAQGQFWTIARRQLLEIGLSARQVRGWLQSGLLYSKYPGVYAYGRPDLPVRGELAAGLLFAGRGSALSGLTALWWMELLGRRPHMIHLDAPGDRRSRQDLLLRHPAAIDRRLHRDLPVVTLPRALLLASESLTLNSLRLVLARAEFKHLLSLPSLQSALSNAPRGTRAVRAAMDAHLPQLARCSNRLERSFILLCERFGLEIPEPNERIGRYRPDTLWPNHRLIVELDGKDAHSTAAQLASDAARQSHLESQGYTVIRFTWWEVEFTPDRVAAVVRAHLSGASRSSPTSQSPLRAGELPPGGSLHSPSV